jgi:ribosomal protein L32
MQLAILVVLIFIAVVLAPWVVGVFAVLVAAYGLWLVIAFAMTLVGSAVALLVYSLAQRRTRARAFSATPEEKIAEANRLYREKESAQRKSRTEEIHQGASMGRQKAPRLIECKNCGASIARHSMFCPECGKPPL